MVSYTLQLGGDLDHGHQHPQFLIQRAAAANEAQAAHLDGQPLLVNLAFLVAKPLQRIQVAVVQEVHRLDQHAFDQVTQGQHFLFKLFQLLCHGCSWYDLTRHQLSFPPAPLPPLESKEEGVWEVKEEERRYPWLPFDR